MVEALPRVAPLEDEDLSKEIARAFRKRGIATHAGASVTGVTDTGDHVEVAFEAEGTAQTVTADVCLVAVGRGPVTDGLGLEEAGVELDRGFVKVDGQLRTTAAHVWAIGDVAATPLQLAHVSFTEGYAVAERIAGIPVPEIDYTQIPRVTYCSPGDRLASASPRHRPSSAATRSWSSGSTSRASARRTSWPRAGSSRSWPPRTARCSASTWSARTSPT